MAATRKPANAVAAEAASTAIPVNFNGVTYDVPPTSEWPVTVLEAFEESRLVAFVKALIGADQYALFLKGNPKVSDLGDFIVAIQQGIGIQGN